MTALIGWLNRIRAPRGSSPSIRHLGFYLIALFGLVAGCILLTALTTYVSIQDQLRKETHKEILRSQALGTLEKQLVQPILLSRWMSRDTFLQAWIRGGEKNPREVLDYLKSISETWKVSAFVASDRTRTYYFSDGTSKALTPDAPDVGWFFHLLEQRIESLADVGYNNGDTTQPFLYIDIRMPDIDGRTSAYVGAAVELDRFLELLETFRKAYGGELHFVNQDEMVILSTRRAQVNTPAKDYDWFRVLADQPHRHDGLQEEATLFRSEGNERTNLGRRWLEELGWHLYIERDQKEVQAGLDAVLYRTLGFVSLIVVLALLAMAFLLQRFRKDLDEAFTQIKTLKGILPICCSCKKIRDDQGYWQQLEHYIQQHSQADLSHGICPDCARKLYPQLKLGGLDPQPPPENRD